MDAFTIDGSVRSRANGSQWCNFRAARFGLTYYVLRSKAEARNDVAPRQPVGANPDRSDAGATERGAAPGRPACSSGRHPGRARAGDAGLAAAAAGRSL